MTANMTIDKQILNQLAPGTPMPKSVYRLNGLPNREAKKFANKSARERAKTWHEPVVYVAEDGTVLAHRWPGSMSDWPDKVPDLKITLASVQSS
jgi:hypothetical protein